ncbi:uncharacterized protein CTHT_0004560 [Thermochaetoides thermophila DSM 1495]|uniref:Protein kinase domain-containing protein n=1 Tax=Chaetomium thermophilum (strain DSM 1495 / CBS 144.50 / IMI 039719) TaxID=759272 RepID=G0RXW8_CHATD|nr:hypothetical protein CTHT_0004560 [Thermochaetoides thermophila DSM 1495]EGS23754.1 hypothetical protein CTHT_0004560 [Thermochaetoides thermophila DSM 1495]
MPPATPAPTFWDSDTIERTVTREFVCSHLIPEEIAKLDQTPSFGDGLTDLTYWEWINQKAKRFFLILVDLDLPDQIFGLIDDSWEDEDLPIPRDQVERLALKASKDEATEWKFYLRQYRYLMRPLNEGEHLNYDDDEIVPVYFADKKHMGVQSQPLTKVVLPNHPGAIFSRAKVTLGPGRMSEEEFMCEVENLKALQHDHLLSYWASYIHRGCGYVIFRQAAEYSLKSLFTATPSCFKKLEKKDRRQTVMNWIFCLVDTICFLHNRGLVHGNIKPSTVMFTEDNQVFLCDYNHFLTQLLSGQLESDANSFDKEVYDYSAPEMWLSSLPSSPMSFRSAKGRPTPQAADIFSLGCIILELLSFLAKKHGKPFATHRAAKNKMGSRGAAVPDSSFHKNLGQVESWMNQLAHDLAKKDDPTFKGVPMMLHVVEDMLSYYPAERPLANEVQTRTYQIVTNWCGITEPHCVHKYGEWEHTFSSLSLGSSYTGSKSTISTARSSRPSSGGNLSSGASSLSSSYIQPGDEYMRGAVRDIPEGKAVPRKFADEKQNHWKAQGHSFWDLSYVQPV